MFSPILFKLIGLNPRGKINKMYCVSELNHSRNRQFSTIFRRDHLQLFAVFTETLESFKIIF